MLKEWHIVASQIPGRRDLAGAAKPRVKETLSADRTSEGNEPTEPGLRTLSKTRPRVYMKSEGSIVMTLLHATNALFSSRLEGPPISP